MRLLRPLAVAALALQLLAPIVAAAPGDVPARIAKQSVYDLAGALSTGTKTTAESILSTVRRATGTDVVLVVASADEALTDAALRARSTALGAGLGVGEDADGGILVNVSIQTFGCTARVDIAPTAGLAGTFSADAAQAIVDEDMEPLIEACDLDNAVLVGLGQITRVLVGGGPTGPGGPGASGAPATDPGIGAGPPFPAPIDGVRVYDTAHAFRADTLATVAKTIAAIEARTGAQVVVYSQLVEDGRTTEEADGDARALMDQWGVGRKGFDDGLVILFDLYPGLEHGQVILYGGPGYRAAFLDNGEKQRLFDEAMLPRLKASDLDGALLVAIERVDENATPEHAATLGRARQLNAVVGLIGAPLVALLLLGSAAWSWLRFGRDPTYLDDPSIHMAGPPEALTPSAAVFVLNGGSSRRALTTALLDLASRGRISFREERHLLGLQKKVGIETRPADPDPLTAARQARNNARRLGPAEELVARRLDAVEHDDAGYIEAKDLPAFAPAVPAFDAALEGEVVRRDWYREAPSKTKARWRLRSGLAIGIGIAAIIGGASLPSDGLLVVGIALVISGAIVFAVAGVMPAVTLPGAMIRAMLAAYRRTLKKTMDQARSMDQVVAESGLAWLETPDQAVVWGTALGLHAEIEGVLGRSLEDLQSGRATAGVTYLPTWYGTSAGGGPAFAGGGDFAGAGAGSGGLFSSSGIPDFGGMMSALGSIGNAPSSSGSGGGGGFGGGGSGGGGGGSGGGF
jgi:uncharacterized membrane protein YgcG